MKICDVCGKKTLFYNKFGDSCVCKSCMLKSGSLSWNQQYESYADANKQRAKARTSFIKHNFPQSVIDSIDEFFMNQIEAMKLCECCLEKVSNLKTLGDIQICKRCYNKLDTSEWHEDDYENNQDVENNRKKMLKIAEKNSFSLDVIREINRHFDEKIQSGLICTLHGVSGQKIKMYDTYSILVTDSNYDVDENYREFNKAAKAHKKNKLVSNSEVKSLTRSILLGNVFDIVSQSAQSIANVTANIVAPEDNNFRVVRGSYRIDYLDYDYIEYCAATDELVGYIRFHENKSEDSFKDDIVFIFDDNRNIADMYEVMMKKISELKESVKRKMSEVNAVQKVEIVSPNTSAADEILKYKNLLDIGAITQDEYEQKKRELLRL